MYTVYEVSKNGKLVGNICYCEESCMYFYETETPECYNLTTDIGKLHKFIDELIASGHTLELF